MSEWKYFEDRGIVVEGISELAKRGCFYRCGVKIEFSLFPTPNAKHHVVLLTGWDECFLKYSEVIMHLIKGGCAVYTMDHRGQGLSGRETIDPQMTYISNFIDYVNDVDYFITDVIGVEYPINLLAHSMGGFIASLVAAHKPHLVKRLIVTSPMFQMKTGYPMWVTKIISGFGVWLNLHKSYIPGQEKVIFSTAETAKVTHDENKIKLMKMMIEARPDIDKGGMSFGWVSAAVDAEMWFKNNMDKVKCPTLLCHADEDAFVVTSTYDDFFLRAKHCTKIKFTGTYHELFMERKGTRQVLLEKVLEFITSDRPMPPKSIEIDAEHN